MFDIFEGKAALRKELESQCWFITEEQVPGLLNLGFGLMPVLVRCHSHRFTCRLEELAERLKPVDHELRDVSTWPETFDTYAKNPKVAGPCPPKEAYMGYVRRS